MQAASLCPSPGPVAFSVADVLRLLSTGGGGPILMALAARPLRTMQLTERLSPYTPRTIYRQVARLVASGLVERSEGEGVPSTVLYRLSSPSGRALCRLLRRHIGKGRTGAIDGERCTALYLLAEAWEAGWVEELGGGGRTPTEIAKASPDLTFHQVSHRIHLLRLTGLLRESRRQGRGRRYQMTERARRDVAVLLEVGRWRRQHLLGGSGGGATVPEVGAALKTLVPLAEMPAQSGRAIKLGVAGHLGTGDSSGSRVLHATVRDDGLCCVEDIGVEAGAWAIGTTHTWIVAILDGSRGRMRVGGDLHLVDGLLRQLSGAGDRTD